MAESVMGSFSFTVLDRTGNLYFIRGDNQLCIYQYTKLGFYLYASTEEILMQAAKQLGLDNYEHEEVMTKGGDILRIDANGQLTWDCFNFDEYGVYGYSYSSHSLYYDNKHDLNYWEGLKSVAGSMGFSSDEIDRYRDLGYPPDVVEELLYSYDREEAIT
jgi:hypothetical protein